MLLVGSCSANPSSNKATLIPEITKQIMPFSEEQLLEYLRSSQFLDPIEGVWSESSLVQLKYDNKLDMSQSYNKINSTKDKRIVLVVKEDLKQSSSFVILFYKQGTVISDQRFGEYSTTLVKDLIDSSKYYGSASGLVNGKPIHISSEYILNGDKLHTVTTSEANVGGDPNHHFLMKTEFLYQRMDN
jgi:hypothetical protein